MAACDPNDKYIDVKAYTNQWKLAQQSGTTHLVPWPPKNEQLAMRCMDAYYVEQLAYYNGWCKQTNMKHVDLPGNLFTQWKSMPGRLVMYNTRKALKKEWDENHPTNVGMTASTNPFADPEAVAAEQQQAQAAQSVAVHAAIQRLVSPCLCQQECEALEMYGYVYHGVCVNEDCRLYLK